MSDSRDRAGLAPLLDTLAAHPDSLRLLRAAALYRRPVDVLGLVALVGTWEGGDEGGETTLSPPPSFAADLQRLHELGLIGSSPGEEDDVDWQVPSWVAAGLPPFEDDDELRETHARAAHFWGWRATAVTGDVLDLMEARHHHIAADEMDAAGDLTCVIAEAFTAEAEAERAEALVRDALTWAPQGTSGAARLWRDLGAACLLQGHHDEAEEHYQRCLEIASDIEDVALVNDAVFALATVAQEQGRLEDASNLYQRALSVFLAEGRNEAAVACRHNLGALAARRGDYETAERELRAAADGAADDEERARSLHELGMAAQWQGHHEHARDVLAESLRLAEAAHSEDVLLSVRVQLGSLALEQGDLDGAEQHARIASGLATAGGDERSQAYTDVLLASVAWVRGDTGRTASLASRALARAKGSGDPSVETSAEDYLGLVALERGDFEAALGHFRAALACAEGMGAQASIATEQAHIATALRERGDADEAEAGGLLDRARETFRSIGHATALAWCDAEEAEALRKAGRLEEAGVALGRAEEIFERVDSALGRSRAGIERARLAEAGGDSARALTLLEAAWPESQRLGDRSGAAHAASRMGVLVAARDGAEAALPWTLRALGIRLAQRSRHAAEDLATLTAHRSALGADRFETLLAAHDDAETVEAVRKALGEL